MRKRSYDDGCATAHALDLIGERWGLLVVRELLLGPKRFTDLRAGLPGISPNVLAQRLDEMEAASILRRRHLPPPAASWVYELTPWGTELEPLIQAIGRWAARSPTLPLGRPMSVNSLVLSLRTMFDPASAKGLDTEIGLHLLGQPFRVRVAHKTLEIVPGEAHRPAVTLTADPNALAAVIFGGRPLADAVKSGEVTLTGDAAIGRRFVGLFPLPERAPATA